VVEKLRLTTSGTEAVMSALRLARALTGREKVLKFAGGYHGHADSLLVKAGSGAATLGLPDSPGVTRGAAGDTLVAVYNDVSSARAALESAPGLVAAILVEPVAGNMGLVLPDEGFLPGLRLLADEHGALLIFDEVMSGFRAARGGAVERFGVRPDLVTLGKIIGGGLPVGAYGGRAEDMDMVAPAGPVYQAGTMAGNPIVAAAGIATLDALLAPGEWERAEAYTTELAAGIAGAAATAGAAVQTAHCGTMLGVFFTAAPVRNYDQALESDTAAYALWFAAMLDRGVYLAPSQFETLFVSTAHAPEHLAATLAAASESLAMSTQHTDDPLPPDEAQPPELEPPPEALPLERQPPLC
jgi:glutamate-1-semialdehyde 2,1-aminomutase